MLKINSKRESGIELLKVIALFLIILCHAYSSFATAKDYTNGNMCIFDNVTFSVIEYFIFQIFITAGYIGNMIFFVCSAWFLVDSKNNKIEKIIKIVLNTFIISILFLSIYLLLGKDLDGSTILKCIFPITNENNWYITCYLLFYAIYPYLNIVIEKIDRKEHLSLCVFGFVLYFIVGYFSSQELFYVNKLVTFVIIYFIIAYIKKYNMNLCDNKKFNLCILTVCLFIFYSMIFVNFAICPINIKWHVMNNPFFLFIAISLVNIFRRFRFNNGIVNTISGLSLFIYVIHDNLIFRSITRELLASIVMVETGTNLIAIKMIAFTLLLLFASATISYLYYLLTNEFISNVSMKIKNILIKLI